MDSGIAATGASGADASGTRPRAAKEPARKAAAGKRSGATKRAAVRTVAGRSRVSRDSTRSDRTTDSGGQDARPWGRFVRRDLYRRGVRRADEQWPLVGRILSAVLRRPEVVLRVLGAEDPVVRDGQVLHRGLQALLRVSDRFGGTEDGSPVPAMLEPTAMRFHLSRSARAVMPVRTDVYVSTRYIPGPEQAPSIAIRTYRRFGAGLGARTGVPGGLPGIVYFHGGGWVTGDLDTHDALCRLLTVASGCVVVSVDYRLAPENPFPAAVDDALTAYRWVHEHSDELGIAAGHIGVMGDSAGGNLAAVVAQRTRARSGAAAGRGRAASTTAVPPPVAQALVYAVLDARLETESMRSLADGFLLTRATMEFYRDNYLPDGADREDPSASPSAARDLSGLAPALVVTAGFDPLRDDGDRYAEALRAAGVVVDHRRYVDQMHGFMSIGIVPDSLALATEVCESMGRLMRRFAPADGA